MAINIFGKIGVTKLEDITSKGSNRVVAIKGTGYYGVKNNEGEWNNEYVNIKIVGKGIEKADSVNLEDKMYIDITEGKVSNRAYQDKNGKLKTWIEFVIFDFDKVEKEVTAVKPKRRGVKK